MVGSLFSAFSDVMPTGYFVWVLSFGCRCSDGAKPEMPLKHTNKLSSRMLEVFLRIMLTGNEVKACVMLV